MSFRTALTAHRSLKVAAGIAALVLWFLAKGEQTTAREFALPLVLSGVPDGLTTVEPVPEIASVVLSGAAKDILRLRMWAEPFAKIDLTGAEPNRTMRVSLSEANIVLPSDSDVTITEIRYPRTLDLVIDRTAERRVPVDAALAGAPATGHFVLGEPLCVPDSVTVIGPARVVRAITSVRTAPLDLSGRTGRVEASRTVNVSERSNLFAVPREVRVAVDIEGTATRTLAGLFVRAEREPGSARATVAPATVDLDVSGPAHLVDALRPEDVSVTVDVRGLPRGTHDITPDVTLPEGVLLASARPSRFTVTLR